MVIGWIQVFIHNTKGLFYREDFIGYTSQFKDNERSINFITGNTEVHLFCQW